MITATHLLPQSAFSLITKGHILQLNQVTDPCEEIFAKLWPKPWPFAWLLEAPGIELFASSHKLPLPLSRNVLHDAWLMYSKAVTVLHPYAWTDGLRCPDATALVIWLRSSLNWRKSFGSSSRREQQKYTNTSRGFFSVYGLLVWFIFFFSPEIC